MPRSPGLRCSHAVLVLRQVGYWALSDTHCHTSVAYPGFLNEGGHFDIFWGKSLQRAENARRVEEFFARSFAYSLQATPNSFAQIPRVVPTRIRASPALAAMPMSGLFQWSLLCGTLYLRLQCFIFKAHENNADAISVCDRDSSSTTLTNGQWNVVRGFPVYIVWTPNSRILSFTQSWSF